MDQKEYDALLAAIERSIESSLRGYRRGTHFQILGRVEETAQEHDRLCSDSDGDSGDQYLDADVRGYREGRRGT